jgi:hypothetical protein
MFDVFWRARERPRRSAHAHNPVPRQPRIHAHAHARAYKSHPDLDRTPPRVADPTRAHVRRSLPREQGASGRASHDYRRPAKPATPAPSNPRDSLYGPR